jgi:hypothetical protein
MLDTAAHELLGRSLAVARVTARALDRLRISACALSGRAGARGWGDANRARQNGG